jgi:p-aminobenzoyl-glutamate transporter AbgT
MQNWCLVHPIMTFWLIVIFIFFISSIFENYFTVQNNKLKLELLKIENKKKEQNHD